MDITIIILICVALVTHRHLSTYWQSGNLPYRHGFELFVQILNIIYLVNFIWLFGFLPGLVLSILTFFQIVFATFLWVFLVPGLIMDNRKSNMEFFISKKAPSQFIQGGWTYLLIGLGVLTIINFFIGSYSSLWDKLLELFGGELKEIIKFSVIAIVAGNILRIITLKLITK